MVQIVNAGPHFSDPRNFMAVTNSATTTNVISNANATTAAGTTAFFTELATRGLQDQTNWSAGTYKTLLSVASGYGFVGAIIGCTAGGAETTTFEITTDGVLREITITNASGERAMLLTGALLATAFTTAGFHFANAFGTLGASATTFQTNPSNSFEIPHWGWLAAMGTPLLQFKTSLLIRAKHSASITNSTATAYSGVMYRLGIAA